MNVTLLEETHKGKAMQLLNVLWLDGSDPNQKRMAKTGAERLCKYMSAMSEATDQEREFWTGVANEIKGL